MTSVATHGLLDLPRIIKERVLVSQARFVAVFLFLTFFICPYFFSVADVFRSRRWVVLIMNN